MEPEFIFEPLNGRFCPSCKTNKSLSEFWKDGGRSDGLTTYCKLCKTEKRWMSQYGITRTQYEALLQEQKSCCAICGGVLVVDSPHDKMRPCVDHNHTSKEVRGILCMHCNAGLGHYKDNAELLKAAAAYIERCQ